LKQVTVLFVDVVRSTAMGQRLGPEEIHAVMDGALERFMAVVQSHYGRVLQYTGDDLGRPHPLQVVPSGGGTSQLR
jgi:class 3 adenylate cyclase